MTMKSKFEPNWSTVGKGEITPSTQPLEEDWAVASVQREAAEVLEPKGCHDQMGT